MGLFDTVKKIVVGDVAHDAVDSGNPVKIGGYASLNVPPNVSAGDRVQAFFDQAGRQVVKLDEATLERINYPPAVAYGMAMIGEVEDRSNGNGANTTNTNMDRVRLGREQELIVMQPTRWAYANYSTVAGAADLTFSTTSIWQNFVALTTGSLSGTDITGATFWIRFPMLSFSRGAMIGLQNVLGVSLNVKLRANIAGASTDNTLMHPQMDVVDVAHSGAVWFSPFPVADGANASIRYVPMLNAPMFYCTLELTAASDPASGGLLIAVAR